MLGSDDMQTGDYAVKPTCKRDEDCLIDFLESNGFRYAKNFENNPSNGEYLIVINVIHRTYFRIDRYFLNVMPMSEIEFLNKIKYYPKSKVIRRSLYSDDNELLYDGYTVDYCPFGLGTSYFANGNKFQEGVFYTKGLIEGMEYYPTGQVRFEGILQTHGGYGPNYPKIGKLYSEDGDLIFSGKFEVKRGGVGFPMMKYPRYRFLEKRPKIDYLRSSYFGD